MNLTKRILEIYRTLDENYDTIVESVSIEDETIISLYVLNKHNIKPGLNDTKILQKQGYLKNGKITKDGLIFLKRPEIQKKLKSIMS